VARYRRVRVAHCDGPRYFRACSPVRRGLVVTRTEVGTYSVTHRASGRKVGIDWLTLTQARRVWQSLCAASIDWTQSYEALRVNPATEAIVLRAMWAEDGGGA